MPRPAALQAIFRLLSLFRVITPNGSWKHQKLFAMSEMSRVLSGRLIR